MKCSFCKVALGLLVLTAGVAILAADKRPEMVDGKNEARPSWIRSVSARPWVPGRAPRPTAWSASAGHARTSKSQWMGYP